MPGVDGLAATREITADPELAGVHVLVLTTFDHDEYVIEALGVGAAGFLVKNTEPRQLLHGIRVVAGGEALLSRDSRAASWHASSIVREPLASTTRSWTSSRRASGRSSDSSPTD